MLRVRIDSPQHEKTHTVAREEKEICGIALIRHRRLHLHALQSTEAAPSKQMSARVAAELKLLAGQVRSSGCWLGSWRRVMDKPAASLHLCILILRLSLGHLAMPVQVPSRPAVACWALLVCSAEHTNAT